MSDFIETFAYNSDGGEPWHKHGNAIQGLATKAEMLAASGLDWQVKKEPAEFGGVSLASQGMWYTVRQSDKRVLGAVGDQYHVIQNVELFNFLDAVITESQAVYETAGSLKGGKICFACASLNHEFYVAKDDCIKPYIITGLGHDGSLQFSAFSGSLRPVCWNTFSAALQDASGEFGAGVVKIPHRSGAEKAIRAAHTALGLATRDASKLAEIYRDLATHPMGIAEFNEFVKAMFPSKREEEKGEPNALVEAVREYLFLAFDAPINNLSIDSRHTGWTALNAVTQFVDHYQSPRKRSVSPTFRSWFGDGLKIRTRAVKYLSKTLLKRQTWADEPEYVTGLTAALQEDVRALRQTENALVMDLFPVRD
jgi:phage/plasmid-like protein (TIGR03299 family)